MHIVNSPKSKNRTIVLEYDPGDQIVLRDACALARETLRSPGVVKALAPQGHTMTTRLEAAEKILWDLATTSERQLQLTILKLQTAGELVMLVASYRSETQQPVSILPKAAILLARVTVCPLPILPLPPAAEVFDKAMSTSSIWEDFEFIRKKKDGDPPYLMLLRAYALWFALRAVSQDNAQLQTLLGCLETITRMFRFTMGSLAAADFADGKATKERDGRKT
jgi:hypothetical protein